VVQRRTDPIVSSSPAIVMISAIRLDRSNNDILNNCICAKDWFARAIKMTRLANSYGTIQLRAKTYPSFVKKICKGGLRDYTFYSQNSQYDGFVFFLEMWQY